MLCSDKIRAVDREERLARLDRFADVIGENILDETRNLRMNVRNLRFVVSDPADRPNFFRDLFHLRRRGFYSY